MGSTEIERHPSRTFHDQRVSPITGVDGVLPVDHQDIVAGTADQGISPWPTFEKVVAGSALQEPALRSLDTKLFRSRRSDDTDDIPGRRLDAPCDRARDHLDQGAVLGSQPADAVVSDGLPFESHGQEA